MQPGSDHEAKVTALVDRSPFGVCLAIHDRLTYVNPAGLRILGASGSIDLIGRGVKDIFGCNPAVLCGESNGNTVPFRPLTARVGGAPIEIEATAWEIPFGADTAVQVMFQPAARPAATVPGNDETLRLFMEYAPLMKGIVELDPDDRDILHVYDNPASCRFLGLKPGQTQGRRAGAELGVSEDVVRKWVRHFRESEARGEPVRFSYASPDPGSRWLEARVWRIGESANGRTRFCYTCEDITERKLAERGRLESEERYRALVEAASEVVWTAPSGGANALGAYELHWLNSIHPDDVGAAIADWQHAASRATRFEGMYRAGRDGAYRWLHVRAVPRFDEQGAIVEWVGMNADITAQRESEERFHTLADNISQLAWMADAQGWIFWYNQRWYDYTGTTLHDVEGWEWTRVHHPDHVNRVVERIRASFESGEPWEDTFPLRGRDGEYRWFLSRAQPIRNEAGAVVRWFGTNTDITELRESKIALEESEAKFRSLVESLPLMVFLCNEKGDISYANPASCELLGYDAPEFAEGRIGWDHIAPARATSIEDFLVARDGRRIPVLRGRASLDPDKKRSVHYAVDLTDLRRTQSRLQAICDAAPAAITVRGYDGSLILCNREAERVFGRDIKRLDGVTTELSENGDAKVVEEVIRLADGPHTYLSVKFPLRDELDRPYAWASISTDMTDRKRIEVALRRSNEDLQQFAYVASHDLQEPLRTVATHAQLLQRRYANKLDEDADRIIRTIVGGALRMGTLVQDLLAYSRATSDSERVYSRVELQEVFDDVIGMLRTRIDETCAGVTCKPLPTVWGDRGQLTQVFQNLLENALKYCRPGVAPMVHVEVVRRETDWHFSLADNGEGFSPQHASRIFGLFKRLHGQEIPGTGIGLAICKTVVERHGGRIWADAVPGEGATFHFTLPCREQAVD